MTSAPRPPFALLGVMAALSIFIEGSSGSVVCSPKKRLADAAAQGAALFVREFTPSDGLGPLFNRTSCVNCHAEPIGGVGPNGLATVLRVGRLTPGGSFDALIGEGGPVARLRVIDHAPCRLTPGIPAAANVTSVRNTLDLRGSGLIDAISEETIRAGAVARGDGVYGRVNLVIGADGQTHVGRFGWKAGIGNLTEFVADAFRNELGITSLLAPIDVAPRSSGCAAPKTIEIDRTEIEAVRAFIASLPPPRRREERGDGLAIFQAIGCALCHTPSLPAGRLTVPLFSDLLLHDLGPELDDEFVQGSARGPDWRTTPLWGVGGRRRLLHDGRAHTASEAILAHGGEATHARERFRELPPASRENLLEFLHSL
jgi:CxxC motif-containing protein (DUF1111 family)